MKHEEEDYGALMLVVISTIMALGLGAGSVLWLTEFWPGQ